MSKIPRIEKIIVNPSTKKILFIKISRRRDVSDSELPARYARKPGIIGRIQGAKKDTIPPRNAPKNEMIIINWLS